MGPPGKSLLAFRAGGCGSQSLWWHSNKVALGVCFISSLLLREKLGVGGPSQLGGAVPGEGLGS